MLLVVLVGGTLGVLCAYTAAKASQSLGNDLRCDAYRRVMSLSIEQTDDFTTGSLKKRAQALIPLLVPLFVSSFKRAEELATAMECRCYRGDNNRTKLVKLELKARDYLWLFGFAVLIGIVVCLSVLPYEFELRGLIFDVVFYKI